MIKVKIAYDPYHMKTSLNINGKNIRKGGNEYEIIDCYNQPDVSRMQIMKAFMAIDRELTPVRNRLAPAEAWSVMTMIVDSNGNMKTHFDYADISESIIEYTRNWEQQYL